MHHRKNDKRPQSLVEELASGLNKNVYSEEGVAVIELTRTILDLPAFAIRSKEPGVSTVKISVTEFPKFQMAVLKIPILSLKDVPEEMKSQFKTFIERLGELTADYDVDELHQTDAKELNKQFFIHHRSCSKTLK